MGQAVELELNGLGSSGMPAGSDSKELENPNGIVCVTLTDFVQDEPRANRSNL